MAESTAAVVDEQVIEQETTPVTKSKSKKQQTGNLILDIAHEIETYSKTKALNEAQNLSTDIEVNYFKLGGILSRIQEESWFEGYAAFEDFVFETFGFKPRKARYWIDIYKNLVEKQIPWDKVSHIGWTKLKDLAPILTLDNLDEWVAKADVSTVAELQALIKVYKSGGKPEEAEVTNKTKSNFKAFKVMLPENDLDICQQALAKAKGELQTDYDNVALANIMSNYLGNVTLQPQAGTGDLDTVIKTFGLAAVLERVTELHPEVDITLDYSDTPEGQAAKAAAESAGVQANA